MALTSRINSVHQRQAGIASRKAKIASMRPPTYEEEMANPNVITAPYGIRWGASAKGSVVHIMDFNKYGQSFSPTCGRANTSKVHYSNVYLSSKLCASCNKWLRLSKSRAVKADWSYYTDPLTGKTKREKHN